METVCIPAALLHPGVVQSEAGRRVASEPLGWQPCPRPGSSALGLASLLGAQEGRSVGSRAVQILLPSSKNGNIRQVHS